MHRATRRYGAGKPRSGFTLIEMLIVLGIMLILLALTTGVLSRVRISGQYATANSEVNQLSDATSSFNKDFGFAPPSHVIDTDSTNALQVRRFQFPTYTTQPEFALLQRMWPRWTPDLVGGTGPQFDFSAGKNINYAPLVQAGGVFSLPLDPNQCLVAFLGGPNQTGWDPTGPWAPLGNTKKGPYYDFTTSTARMKTYFSGPSTDLFPHYCDIWGQPYAYFAANQSSDSYDPRVMFRTDWTNDPTPPSINDLRDPWYTTATKNFPSLAGGVAPGPAAYIGTAGIANGMTPFQISVTPVKWVNPQKCQVISAGVNQVFGPGGLWSPGTAPYGDPAAILPALKGGDDTANFNGGLKLAIPNN